MDRDPPAPAAADEAEPPPLHPVLEQVADDLEGACSVALSARQALLRVVDLPTPDPSIRVAYRDMMRAVLRQKREPGYYLRRELPPTARPYKDVLHEWVPERERA